MKKYICCAVLLLTQFAWTLERQANADYHARRQALAGKTSGGAVLLFAPNESDGPNDIYGYRADDNFFYLTGWVEPGAAVLIVPAAKAMGENEAHPYVEILFLPNRNYSEEKWTGPKLGPDSPEAASQTGFDRVEVLDKLRDELVRLLRGPSSTPTFPPEPTLRTLPSRSTG
jgi:Xaa-Pro aminopeptidase